MQFELKRKGINTNEILSSQIVVPLTWKPSVAELVILELYKYRLVTRYLRRPPCGGLKFKIHFKMILQHVVDISLVILSPEFRRARQKAGRRNLDISLAYTYFLPFLIIMENDWVLHLEDDAQLLLPISETASTISMLLSKLDLEFDHVWLADLSKSFSLSHLNLSSDFYEFSMIGSLKYARIQGRASNTLCALLVPTKTWLGYLDHLSRSLKTRGLRLMPCDWIFNDFAEAHPRISSEFTLISEQGLFLQNSLHSSARVN